MKMLYNDNWKFAEFELGTSMEEMEKSDRFMPVDIPHDWMIYHVNDLYKNSIGFYKKTSMIFPEEGKTYILRFEGVYMNCKIYINGEEAFEWKYGYSTFDVDGTKYLQKGLNTIYVVCTYQAPNSRWYSGAGIYRNVYVIEKEDSYICQDGVYLSTENIAGNDFKVFIDTEVISKSFNDGELKHIIRDKEGNVVSIVEKYVPLCTEKYVSKLDVDILNARRWDINDPYLYSVESLLSVDGKVVDSVINPLGFRTVRFDNNKGFFLNERNLKINGACQHHDLGALGAAMNKSALRRQFEMLKEMGVNSIRTSHNMPAKEVMELADEMGLLICSEAFDMWEKPKTGFDYGNFFTTWWKKDITSWVRRDRNHPSLIIWSIGNEIYDTHAGNGYKWTILLRDATRELDYRHNAYIGIGSNYIAWEGAQKCAQELELSGYNYGEKLYDEHHNEKFPNWCIFGSETASTVQSRGIYHFPYEKRLLTYEDGQCSSLGNCSTNWGAVNTDAVISEHRDRDFVAGQYIWTGWDYIGEPTPYFSKNSFFGQIDTAGFKKDTFFCYQAEWTDVKKSPMVHLYPYWDYNLGQIIDVCAVSNADDIELFVNGESRGKQHIDHKNGKVLHAHWKVSYVPGEIKAVAYDQDGNVVATDVKRSFGDPESIVLKVSKESISADGCDLSFVEISTVDTNGNPVENARNRIEVTVEGNGRLIGLDNGDSTDYEEYKTSNRKLFSGKLLAIVASNGNAGTITVKASSEGLKGGECKIEAVASSIVPGSSYNEYIEKKEFSRDIPVRKIELMYDGNKTLGKDLKEVFVDYKVYPSNATYDDISIKALTYDGIEANFVKVETRENKAVIKALGDGAFKLTAFANNGKDHAEVISELEFEVTGLGKALLNPYEHVAGIEFSSCSHETKLSFEGGVFVDTQEGSWVSFDNVDFGDFGSNEISLPIFSFEDEIPLEIWEGSYGSGKLLGKYTYQAKSIYNTYQTNTFILNSRIKGVKTVTIYLEAVNRFSLKGFSFKKPDKTYEVLSSVENSRITGDSFKIEEDVITSIGNNVTIEYEDMDFSKEGLSSVTICGRSNNEKTSIHLLFTQDTDTLRQMVEVSYSEDYEENTFALDSVGTVGKVSVLFLPGSDFDLKWIKFNK
ncbi:MAG: DUF4982 domain-containing protein [Lachnospiraceae bacterium]|nr:DUF4982 domain-containing protein [Lachnospiraceae bacterium]